MGRIQQRLSSGVSCVGIVSLSVHDVGIRAPESGPCRQTICLRSFSFAIVFSDQVAPLFPFERLSQEDNECR
jgi:hypothetical protein